MSAVSINRKVSSVLRSIEAIEEKVNRICSQFNGLEPELEHLQSIAIDDTNSHLQIFFQHLEHLLQYDLKNRKSLINAKRTYWHFFALALKESKGLYDTILYVLNCPEVKTSTGRGRLFLRFCLQHHRLGDVIQQSFLITKLVHQFYSEECFWTVPKFIDRIVKALYQLNDVQFDLLSVGQYQLDVCWPSTENADVRLRNSYEPALRLRTNSISSCLSMESLSMSTSSIPITPSSYHNLELSNHHDGSYIQSISSLDEDPENSIHFWKDRCQQLEVQLTPSTPEISSIDAEIQCSIDHQDESIQANLENSNDEKAKLEISILQDELHNLNFQLSSFRMQQSSTDHKMKDYDRELSKYQNLIDTKNTQLNEYQRQIEQQSHQLKTIHEDHEKTCRRQEQRLENLTKELSRVEKLLEDERKSFEQERSEHKKLCEKWEASLHEKTLDFEEMKRRLVKAIQEKAELFNSLYSYEIKLEEEQSRHWVHEDDVHNCTRCQTVFGWTLRKYRCRHCQKIFCYYCCNHWKPGATPSSPQHRLCTGCYETFIKESLMTNYTLLDDPESPRPTTTTEADLNFQVRSECLSSTPDV